MSTVYEIRSRAAAATKGPWHWSGNPDSRQLALSTWISGAGRCNVMDFVRWGMQGARPRFMTDLWMHPVQDPDLVYEVDQTATSRNHPTVYRADIVGIRHPDAEFIARSRQDVDDLLAVIAGVEAVCDQYDEDDAVAVVLKAVRDVLQPGDGKARDGGS